MPKSYSPNLKFQVVWEVISEDKSAAEVARAYDVHPNTVRNWVKKFKKNGSEVFAKTVRSRNWKKESGNWNNS